LYARMSWAARASSSYLTASRIVTPDPETA
jgi:hypothetical protein